MRWKSAAPPGTMLESFAIGSELVYDLRCGEPNRRDKIHARVNAFG